MTFPNTIPAWMGETPPSVPDCPPWCLEPAGHYDPTHVPWGWTRFHVAWSGTMTYRDSLRRTEEIVIEVSQYEANETGEDYLEPPRVWLRGLGEDSPLTETDMPAFADLIGQAASTMLRITGGGAMGTSHTRPEVARPAPCPGWCTLPADHLDVEDAGWSRMHEAFSALVPVSRGTRGDVKDAVVFVGQFESWYVEGGFSVQPPHLEVFDLGGGDPLFGAQAVALVAAMSEAGHALARIEEGVTA